MAGSSAWPMAGALRCSIAPRASVFPASIRGYCPGCWRGWGFPPSRCRSWSPNGSAISIPAPLHDWVAPRKPATGPLRARPAPSVALGDGSLPAGGLAPLGSAFARRRLARSGCGGRGGAEHQHRGCPNPVSCLGTTGGRCRPTAASPLAASVHRMSDLHDVLGGMRGWFPRMAGRAWPVRSCRFGSTRQEPSRGRNTRSASTQSTACCHPGSFSRRSVKINDRYSNPPLHPDIAPGFLPPACGKAVVRMAGRSEWVRRGTGVGAARAQWIVDRAWCVYRCLDLNHVPRSDRYQALALSLPPWRLFAAQAIT